MYKKIFLSLLAVCIIVSCSTKSTESSSARTDLSSIPLELTTHLGDQQLFVEGDEIQFLLSIGQDAYVYMFYIDASDRITQILPNPNQRSHFYSAGYFLTIPEYENLYRFTISEPFGEETIWIMASDQSITLDESLGDIGQIKGVIKQASKNAYGEYSLVISTQEKSRR
jgi:hypothetical protein